MKHTRTLMTSALALAVLGACATATPYGPALDSRYGFSETQIENNRWTVSFSGNSLTDLKTVENYLLYRAAELTDQNGYDHFVVVERKVDEDTDYRSTGSDFGVHRGHFFTYQYFHPRFGWRHHYDPFFDDITLREVTRYEAIAEIIMAKGEKPDGNVHAYNADQILINLAGKINRGEAY